VTYTTEYMYIYKKQQIDNLTSKGSYYALNWVWVFVPGYDLVITAAVSATRYLPTQQQLSL